MGWFVKGVMMPDLEKTVVGGKKGALLKVWTSAGLHIVYIKSSPKTDNAYALLLRVFL
jgi:parvulin-like peptidyl-prolyl isomerase